MYLYNNVMTDINDISQTYLGCCFFQSSTLPNWISPLLTALCSGISSRCFRQSFAYWPRGGDMDKSPSVQKPCGQPGEKRVFVDFWIAWRRETNPWSLWDLDLRRCDPWINQLNVSQRKQRRHTHTSLCGFAVLTHGLAILKQTIYIHWCILISFS